MKKVILIFGVFTMASCRPEFYEPSAPGTASPGNLDLTTYVAVGSGITAGFADNALYSEAQSFAYPNLIAGQLREAAPALKFAQPDIASSNGWSGGTNGRLALVAPACSTVAISGKAVAGESGVLPYSEDPVQVTNLAVPFLSIAHVNTGTLPTGTSFNNPLPYYNRFAAGTSGIASEAAKRAPGFFTVWLGYTDALRYATSGGTASLPAVSDFKNQMAAVLDSLLAAGGKGVVANIPYVDLFAVVTNNNRRLTSNTDPARTGLRFAQDLADQYNAALGVNIFSGASGYRNQFAIETGTGTIRAINTSSDFVVRSNVLDSVGVGPRDSLMVRNCTPDLTPRTGVGLTSPIANNAVLDKAEVAYLRQQIDLYNQAIQQLADERNASGIRIAVVDMKTFYNQLTDLNIGIKYGSSVYRANHPSLGPDFGGFYSLDRIHPTPKGQALIANEFIKVMNAAFASSIHLLNPESYRGNTLPQE